jgi:hypothetical protein
MACPQMDIDHIGQFALACDLPMLRPISRARQLAFGARTGFMHQAARPIAVLQLPAMRAGQFLAELTGKMRGRLWGTGRQRPPPYVGWGEIASLSQFPTCPLPTRRRFQNLFCSWAVGVPFFGRPDSAGGRWRRFRVAAWRSRAARGWRSESFAGRGARRLWVCGWVGASG